MITDRIRQNNTGSRASYKLPTSQAGESSSPLFLTVVFTTVPGTLAALRRAAALANQLGAQIRILVPYVVPFPLPLERPQADPAFQFRQFRTLCAQQPIETRIEIKVCRNAGECLLRELTPQSVVLIGGARGWPFSRTLRLAKSLQRHDHHVLFIRSESKVGNKDARCELLKMTGHVFPF